MKVKYNGKWLEVARVQYDYNIGKFCYEIHDKPVTDPKHTEWVTFDEKDDLVAAQNGIKTNKI